MLIFFKVSCMESIKPDSKVPGTSMSNIGTLEVILAGLRIQECGIGFLLAKTASGNAPRKRRCNIYLNQLSVNCRNISKAQPFGLFWLWVQKALH